MRVAGCAVGRTEVGVAVGNRVDEVVGSRVLDGSMATVGFWLAGCGSSVIIGVGSATGDGIMTPVASIVGLWFDGKVVKSPMGVSRIPGSWVDVGSVWANARERQTKKIRCRANRTKASGEDLVCFINISSPIRITMT
jgi:hypothetical protein